MDVTTLQLQQHLKTYRYSLTRSRQLVFGALQDSEPQTMAELVAACGDQLDRATVYRTVDLFEKLGIVQRLSIGWKYKLELTDSFSHHHHHLTCMNCGRVIPLPEDETLENRLNQLAKLLKFVPKNHQIEVRGLCQDCQMTS